MRDPSRQFVGRMFGPYEVLSEIARGFRATDPAREESRDHRAAVALEQPTEGLVVTAASPLHQEFDLIPLREISHQSSIVDSFTLSALLEFRQFPGARYKIQDTRFKIHDSRSDLASRILHLASWILLLDLASEPEALCYILPTA